MGIKDYTVLELLSLINSELGKGLSLNKISENLKIPSSSIRTKLKDYRYNKEENRYVLKENTNEIQKEYKEKSSIEKKDIQLQSQYKYNTITDELSKKDINDLLELVKLKEEIELLIKENKKNNAKDPVENNLKENIKVTHNAKQRMIRVDNDILREWDNFIRENKDYKVQDLYSLAIKEFLNKYNK